MTQRIINVVYILTGFVIALMYDARVRSFEETIIILLNLIILILCINLGMFNKK